jgi:hypothetical protein
MRTSAVLFLEILSTQRREVRVNHCTIVLRIDCSCESNRSTIKILFQMIASTAKLVHLAFFASTGPRLLTACSEMNWL